MVGKMRILVMLNITLATLHTRVGGNIIENVKSEEILEKMENVTLKTYYSPMAHSCSMSPSFVLFVFLVCSFCLHHVTCRISVPWPDSTQATTIKMLNPKH